MRGPCRGWLAWRAVADEPLIPDYAGACVCNVAAVVQDPPEELADWVPQALAGAERSTVLLTLDGLGWNQLQPRRAIAPTLSSVMQGGPVCTVAPSTTSPWLKPISTDHCQGFTTVRCMGWTLTLAADRAPDARR